MEVTGQMIAELAGGAGDRDLRWKCLMMEVEQVF